MKREWIHPFNDKGQRHGLWMGYFVNKNLSYKGYFINNTKVGIWLFYDYQHDGLLEEKRYYI